MLTGDSILQQAATMGRWHHQIRISDDLTIPGLWKPTLITEVLCAGLPEGAWLGKRVLDIGACNGGVSIELARLGASVHAIEPTKEYLEQFKFALSLINQNEKLDIEVGPQSLFTTDRSRRYDVVLFLGLVYHFRYPQLVLDYLTGFNADTFFVSSQTHDSSLLVMENRKEATPQHYGHLVLAGYHPSRPLLKAMIEYAGFKNVTELLTPLTGRDFRNKSHDLTNSAYYIASKGTVTNYEAVKDTYM